MATRRFHYYFIQDPDDALKCSICLEVARGQPMQHGGGCGRLFCKECIEMNGNNPCPMCRGENPQYFPDSRSLRDIKSLGVRCKKVNRGCMWRGTVGTLQDHVAECGYVLVECTNNCRVKHKTFRLMRKNLDKHTIFECPNRAYKCKFCGEEGTFVSITRDHDQHCLRKPIPCPNTECPLTVERGGVKEHVASECEHTIVDCKYSNIGCPERKRRRVMMTHEEDDRIHLRMSLNTVSQLNSTIAQLKVVVKELANTQNNKMSICMDVHNFTAKKEADEVFYSQPFFTVPNGYKMRLSVCCNGDGDCEGTHLSIYSRLLNVPYKDQLKWPFRGTVTIELLNQLEDNNHYERTIKYVGHEDARPGGDSWGLSCFIPLSSLAYNPAIDDSYSLGSIGRNSVANTKYISINDFLGSIGRNSVANIKYLDQDTLHFRVTVKEEELPLK